MFDLIEIQNVELNKLRPLLDEAQSHARTGVSGDKLTMLGNVEDVEEAPSYMCYGECDMTLKPYAVVSGDTFKQSARHGTCASIFKGRIWREMGQRPLPIRGVLHHEVNENVR